jgi:hypothetical protein
VIQNYSSSKPLIAGAGGLDLPQAAKPNGAERRCRVRASPPRLDRAGLREAANVNWRQAAGKRPRSAPTGRRAPFGQWHADSAARGHDGEVEHEIRCSELERAWRQTGCDQPEGRALVLDRAPPADCIMSRPACRVLKVESSAVQAGSTVKTRTTVKKSFMHVSIPRTLAFSRPLLSPENSGSRASAVVSVKFCNLGLC